MPYKNLLFLVTIAIVTHVIVTKSTQMFLLRCHYTLKRVKIYTLKINNLSILMQNISPELFLAKRWRIN